MVNLGGGGELHATRKIDFGAAGPRGRAKLLALREAQTYVFEPSSDDFHALVRRRFERLLSLIHQRGGLKGATPAAAFRVETGASVNPATAIDQGRFLVELRVAPSRPFRHLTVLLLQTGPQQVQVREA